MDPDPPAPAGGGASQAEALATTLHRLTDATGGSMGQAFFERLVVSLSRELGVRHVFVGEVTPDGTHMHARAVATSGEPGRPFSYALAGSPCDEVVLGRSVFVPRNAAALYPDDDLLVRMGVQAYLGHPLFDLNGFCIGALIACHGTPLPPEGPLHTITRLFAERVGSELGREQADAARVASLERSLALTREVNRLALLGSLSRGDVAEFAAEAVDSVLRTLQMRAVGVWLSEPGEPCTLRLRHLAPAGDAIVSPGTRISVAEAPVPEGCRARVIHPSDRETLGTELRALLRRLDPPWHAEAAIRLGPSLAGVLSILPPDGAAPLSELELGFVRDVADLLAHGLHEARHRQQEEAARRLNRQLLSRRSLEELGTLAAGIAHDVGNVLTAVLAGLEELPEAGDEEVRECLRDIRSAGEHGRELVEQIKEFARSGLLRTRTVALAPYLDELATELRRRLPDDVALEVVCAEDPGDADLDPTQIRQAVFNLVDNGARAMGGQGRIRIGLAIEPAPQEGRSGAGPDGDAPAEAVRFTITDEGPGIDPEVMERMWDPFYTTRRGSGGTGIGLAIVDRVVRAHGGRVAVATRPGQGSTFQLELPRRATPADQPPPEGGASAAGRTVG